MNRIPFIFALLIAMVLTACGAEGISTESSGGNVEAITEIEEKVEIPEKETTEEEQADDAEISNADTEEEPNQSNLGDLHVHYIDVGQADASLFQYSDGEKDYTILFDTGDWRGNEVVSYLSARNISYLDLVVISHPDADHIGQLEHVMNAFDVGEVWMSGNESSSQTFERAVEAVLNSEADYYEPRAGEEFDVGPMGVDILYPNRISGKSNEESISILFTYGSVKFLFTGDTDRAGESYMNQNFHVDADILHLGHHGSKTSNDPTFIDAVSPSIAIYSAGAENSYGHPSPEVITTIQDRNIELYGTDVNGTIIVTSDGETFDVETGTSGTVLPESGSAESDTQDQNEVSESTGSDTSTQNNETSAQCININEASAEEVQGIIHIGPARAGDLVDLRPFHSVDDLERISGIGPARIADIKAEGKACVQ